MNVRESSENNCLLAYSISSDPNPIQASPQQGNPSYAALTVVVSNNTVSPIYCNQIKFSIPIGTLAQDLTESADGILVAASPSNKWQITNNKDGSFTATPIKPEYNLITTDGLVFQIYNIQVNKQVGEFTFVAQENSSNDNINFTDKENDYQLAKFPYGFYMKNFAPSSPLVPNGSPVTLTWIASDLATYTILYADKSVDVTNTRNWTSPALNNVTTFILKGTVQYLGETVNNYLSTTVVVANPQITATSLNVLQQSNLNGNTTIGTDTSAAEFLVKGNSTINGNSETKGVSKVSSGLITGGLTVQGNSALSTAAISNSLGVSGQTNLGNTNVNGVLSLAGPFGAMRMASAVGAGNYVAKTDGIVIGVSGETTDVMKKSYTWFWGQTTNLFVRLTGGNHVISYDGKTYYMAVNQKSFTMPVSKGAYWSVGLQNWSENQVNPSITFYWIPIGAETGATFETAAETNLPKIDMDFTLPCSTSAASRATEKAVNNLNNLVAELLGKKMTKANQVKFKKALAALVCLPIKK